MAMKARMKGGPRHSITSLAVLARNDFRQADGTLMLPTPTRQDGCNGTGGPGSLGRDGGENLRTAVGGSLNPVFVERMMGFPDGWTELPGS